MKNAKIAVLGASGYTGSELLRLLIPHPRVEIALITADRKAGQEIGAVYPQFAHCALPKLISIDAVDWGTAALDLAFCALPIPVGRHRVDWRERVPGLSLSGWGPVLFGMIAVGLAVSKGRRRIPS